MHYTLHLTQTTWLTAQKLVTCMSLETALQAQHLATAFPGGEITFLLHSIDAQTEYTLQEVIRGVVAHGTENTLLYHITTDGAGLDIDFLAYATDHAIDITLTWDGISSLQTAPQLLSLQPSAAVLLTVTPETLPHFATNIKALYDLGFRYLYATMAPGAAWKETHLPQLKRQYRTLSSFYREKIQREEKLFFSPFDEKIANRIWQRSVRCTLGQRTIAVNPRGNLYPCVALCDDSYCIGTVTDGIDEKKLKRLCLLNESEPPACVGCALHDRCVHHCACINRCATGNFDKPSPFQCAHERILIPMADSLAERFYKERSAWFMQKHYDRMEPVLSLAETYGKE